MVLLEKFLHRKSAKHFLTITRYVKTDTGTTHNNKLYVPTRFLVSVFFVLVFFTNLNWEPGY